MDRISNATNARAKEKTLHITSCAGFTGVTLSANFWITKGSGLNLFSFAKSALASRRALHHLHGKLAAEQLHLERGQRHGDQRRE